MSEYRTLYRMVGNSYPAEKEEALEDGWLVPVEPNYEAAEAAWQTMFPCVCGSEYRERELVSPQCLGHYVEESRIIVDAALGEPA